MLKNDIPLEQLFEKHGIGLVIVAPNGRDGMLRYVRECKKK